MGVIKARKCKLVTCRIEYLPSRQFQKGCCIDHEVLLGLEAVEKKKRQEDKRAKQQTRARLLELKPPQYWLKRTEKAVNAYCRERDWDQPCISCGTWDAIEWHAGHFIPVGRKSSIRYDYANINRQCSQCNVHKGGNATEYEIRLTAKVGAQEVERLKMAPRLKEWLRNELEAIEADANAKRKAIIKEREQDGCGYSPV